MPPWQAKSARLPRGDVSTDLRRRAAARRRAPLPSSPGPKGRVGPSGKITGRRSRRGSGVRPGHTPGGRPGLRPDSAAGRPPSPPARSRGRHRDRAGTCIRPGRPEGPLHTPPGRLPDRPPDRACIARPHRSRRAGRGCRARSIPRAPPGTRAGTPGGYAAHSARSRRAPHGDTACGRAPAEPGLVRHRPHPRRTPSSRRGRGSARRPGSA